MRLGGGTDLGSRPDEGPAPDSVPTRQPYERVRTLIQSQWFRRGGRGHARSSHRLNGLRDQMANQRPNQGSQWTPDRRPDAGTGGRPDNAWPLGYRLHAIPPSQEARFGMALAPCVVHSKVDSIRHP